MANQRELGPGIQQLDSDHVVVSAPMSFNGSRKRIWRKLTRSRGAGKPAFITLAILVIVVTWAAVAAWYLLTLGLFGIFLFPYRMIRRGQRKTQRELAEQRHLLEVMASERQQDDVVS